jgi:orotate phosphoribosyltransferase
MSEAAAELGDRIYERARLTGEFRLRSGAVSSEYFDKYLFESDPLLLREIAEALVAMLPSGVECCVINREAGGRKNLAAEGLDLRSLLTISELQRGCATDPARS